ncbi:heat shock 9 [Pyrrhoderma noxium]|uniref:Heat shock 9 n=1 Tax=Pyrrhoderma noxium TaxID=2282107 RepID=A0A286UDM1_9AGAM|nr:heat shock 9 [Pyrrhoderma noxium]
MSDNMRQSFGDKMEGAMKPDSEKSSFEQMGDKVKSNADSMASSMQPESEKSYTQQFGDMLSGNSNENSDSMLNKAKNALGMNERKARLSSAFSSVQLCTKACIFIFALLSNIKLSKTYSDVVLVEEWDTDQEVEVEVDPGLVEAADLVEADLEAVGSSFRWWWGSRWGVRRWGIWRRSGGFGGGGGGPGRHGGGGPGGPGGW